MADHEADIATLHQEATQLRARIERYEYALRTVRDECVDGRYNQTFGDDVCDWIQLVDRMINVSTEALQESS